MDELLVQRTERHRGAPVKLDVFERQGPAHIARSLDRAVRRVALLLESSPEAVEANVPAALEKLLCALPWESRLRRERDRIALDDVRLLWEAMPTDDLRRKRLQFLLEHAERRARL